MSWYNYSSYNFVVCFISYSCIKCTLIDLATCSMIVCLCYPECKYNLYLTQSRALHFKTHVRFLTNYAISWSIFYLSFYLQKLTVEINARKKCLEEELWLISTLIMNNREYKLIHLLKQTCIHFHNHLILHFLIYSLLTYQNLITLFSSFARYSDCVDFEYQHIVTRWCINSIVIRHYSNAIVCGRPRKISQYTTNPDTLQYISDSEGKFTCISSEQGGLETVRCTHFSLFWQLSCV